MADKSPRLNEINGIVLHKETQRPLSKLLVVAYDLDPDSENPDKDDIRVNPGRDRNLNDPSTFRKERNQFPNDVPGDRLGSVLTDENGEFRINYEDDAFRVRRKNVDGRKTIVDARPDLFLLVTSAEGADTKEFENVVFRSNWARINAGRLETFLIEIDTNTLKASGVPIPSDNPDEEVLEQRVAALSARKKLGRQYRLKVTNLIDELDAADEQETREVEGKIKNALIRDFSAFNSADATLRFVQPNEEIKTAQDDVLKSSTKRINETTASNNPMPGDGVSMSVYLSAEDKAKYAANEVQNDGKTYYLLPNSLVDELLFKREDDLGVNSILFTDNPISKGCLTRTKAQQCAAELADLAVPDDGAGQNDGGGDTSPADVGSQDIATYVGAVLAPRDKDIFASGPPSQDKERPTKDSVQANVDDFSLAKGPADATAFYDFDTLNIAFDHVWKQLVDETLVSIGKKAHYQLQNDGKKSFLHKDFAIGANALTKLNLVQGLGMSLEPADPIAPVILKHFDITLLEFDAMTNGQKDEILELATEIDSLSNETVSIPEYTGISYAGRGGIKFNGKVSVSFVNNSERIEQLFQQGEMLLENVRLHNPNSTNAIVKELHDRIQAKYEYTVFAADKNESSVNFGLLNTYRQKWEPVAYQAGQLAKTIPMAPKEERKYSVSVKRTIKSSEKEARKNNSVLNSESNLTSRAESEIVAKAQKKSDFDFNINASYAQSSTKLGIGKDATKDSSEVKKAFRESVLKAAQEFKDEWSIEVSTDETMDFSESASGTISNPNEELSVTYLFYQLQRRYRVSEQLYRTAPVVMVALDVPAPHEITEGWVVAHDWILNRALLDDSFRGALEAISTRSVGNTFALRELRKNLREQRRLMRTIERDFAKIQRDVENKYRLLQDSVDDRIGSEHNKRFYKKKLWLWLFGPGEKPENVDPEMAKALEQAAADDHQYAVEQAKQLSMAVQRESRVLNEMTKEYNDAMQSHLNGVAESKRLLTHIKENIIYYMQAIWRMEPPDQRFLQLHKVQVPEFSASRQCLIAKDEVDDLFAEFRPDSKTRHEAWLTGSIDQDGNGQPIVTYKPLVEVADLDTVLGFKGNYVIFPLKKHNALTRFMAAPFVDEAFGAMDPDQLSNVNLEEYSDYICCLHQKLSQQEFDALKPVLKKWLEQLLANPLRNGDEIIVPTDSLFIEMLPSDSTLLEDFKLEHRKMDVLKTRAEIRQMELENIRYAARLVGQDNADPSIDKKIVIHGNTGGLVVDE